MSLERYKITPIIMNNSKISKVYRDRYTSLISDVQEALASGRISNEEASVVLGVIMKKRINRLIKIYLSSILDELKFSDGDNGANNSFLYIDYYKSIKHAGN